LRFSLSPRYSSLLTFMQPPQRPTDFLYLRYRRSSHGDLSLTATPFNLVVSFSPLPFCGPRFSSYPVEISSFFSLSTSRPNLRAPRRAIFLHAFFFQPLPAQSSPSLAGFLSETELTNFLVFQRKALTPFLPRFFRVSQFDVLLFLPLLTIFHMLPDPAPPPSESSLPIVVGIKIFSPPPFESKSPWTVD